MTVEEQIIHTERSLRNARRRYAAATNRGDMTAAMGWGFATRNAIQRLEELGDLQDEGRTAWAIARGI